VVSLRATAGYALTRRATLMLGLDLVDNHWRRRENRYNSDDPSNPNIAQSRGRTLALGTWLGVALRFDPRPGPLIVRAQVRLNVFSDGREARAMPDPRVDLRFRVHPRVELSAAIGQYSFPKVIQIDDSASLFSPESRLPNENGVLDIPIWLITYFDPGIEGESEQGSLLLGRTLQASTSVRVELPWQLGARVTGFWRESGAQSRPFPRENLSQGPGPGVASIPRQRAYGLELLLDRALARDIHGWIGYTLLRSQSESAQLGWLPADFDQRHNLVALLSFGLPRGFRFGVRFRLVSGNPDSPIRGARIVQDDFFGTRYEPIRGVIGSEYRPLFHQLDLRLDKTWHAKRASISAYFDVQNVYNHLYPELWYYTTDFRERSDRIGLPIFPSLGVRVDY
jgi:hypothetical protein